MAVIDIDLNKVVIDILTIPTFDTIVVKKKHCFSFVCRGSKLCIISFNAPATFF